MAMKEEEEPVASIVASMADAGVDDAFGDGDWTGFDDNAGTFNETDTGSTAEAFQPSPTIGSSSSKIASAAVPVGTNEGPAFDFSGAFDASAAFEAGADGGGDADAAADAAAFDAFGNDDFDDADGFASFT